MSSWAFCFPFIDLNIPIFPRPNDVVLLADDVTSKYIVHAISFVQKFVKLSHFHVTTIFSILVCMTTNDELEFRGL